jgi:hypothetical protein
MWPDKESECDFMNFTGVAEVIVQTAGRTISADKDDAR